MSDLRLRGWLALLVGAGVIVWSPGNARAFKTGTHVATANVALEQFDVQLADDGTGTLVFEVNGDRLDLTIGQGEAFRAVMNHPDFFAAGAVGPDGFPDPLTGQILMHADGSDVIKGLVKDITGEELPEHEHWESFESRGGPGEYRSIDFVTSMLAFLDSYSSGPFSTAPRGSDEYEAILAFILGYVSHGVGDAFAHTWVNEIAGGAWELSQGSGLFGVYSEEVKHVAVETMVDKLVPDEWKSVDGDGGGYERIRLRAPVRFLDAFFSSQAANSRYPSFSSTNGSFRDFLEHYSNFNIYNGGFFYNYLNAQTKVGDTLKSWSGFGGVLDLAEDVSENQWANLGLDLAQLPEDVNEWLFNFPNPIGWLPELTGGFVDCHADKFGNPLPTPITDLREALEFVGGINDRIDVYSEKARVIRRNWIKLAQCTSENMAGDILLPA